MTVPEPPPGWDSEAGALHRCVLGLGVVLATLLFALQFIMQVLWPQAEIGPFLLVLYLAAKWIGDELTGAIVPQAPRLRPGVEWTQWIRVALPVAVIQGLLMAVGVGLLRTGAAVIPAALFVLDVGWLRGASEPEPDSLGRRLAAWP